jgi:hypothetical protein
LATCSKHVDYDDDDDIDDAYDDVYDDDDYDDAGAGAGDGDGEPTVHSIMCMHECARSGIDLPSWPANWTATLGSTTGHNHWPALLPPLASSTGHYHWSAPLAGIIGQDPWQHVPNTSTMMTMMMMMLMMIMVIVMVMMNSHYVQLCACMSVHSALLHCQVGQQTGQQHWAAPLASSTGQGSADTD